MLVYVGQRPVFDYQCKKIVEKNYKPKTMETNRMEIFKTIKEHLWAIGFTKPHVGFHTEQVLRTSQGFLAIVLQCLYLLFDANTTKDYLDSLFTTSVGILGKRKNR